LGPGPIHRLTGYLRLALISLAAAGVATFFATVLAAWLVIALTSLNETGGVQALIIAFLLLPWIAIFSISATLAVMPAVTSAAALVGAVLWNLGGRHAYARMRRVWIAVGALFGIAVFGAMEIGMVPDVTGMLHQPGRAQLAASFILSGAGAALVFRAGLKFLALFFLPEEAERDA
jgi:hypothetical protein